MKRLFTMILVILLLTGIYGCQTVKAQTWKVMYDGNASSGGTPPMDALQYLPGQNAVVMGNLGGLTRQGYSFAGWNSKPDGSGTQYQPGSTLFMASFSVTLYARWAPLPPPPLKVLYDGNGQSSGVAPVDERSYEKGLSFTVIGNLGKLEKKGFSFSGWNTAANGSGESFAQGSVVPLRASSMTLYARWVALPPPGLRVVYDGNGNTVGTVPADDRVYERGQNFTVIGNLGRLEKEGYSFAGWNGASDGSGESLVQGSVVPLRASSMTLYARWEPLPPPGLRVVYDGNGNTSGTAPSDDRIYERGQNFTVIGNLGKLEKTGNSFAGWNDTSDGSGESLVQGTITSLGEASRTLYACWIPLPDDSVSISFNGNGASSGTVPAEPVMKRTGEEFTIPANTGNLVRTGYRFEGWGERPDGNVSILVAGATISVGTSPIQLYAQWKALESGTLRVLYNGNASMGGKVPEDTRRYTPGEVAIILGNTGGLTNPGYRFAGWNTEPDGSGVDYLPASRFTLGAKRVVLHVKWFVQPEMVKIPEGEFMMGGTVVSNEQPIHPVSVSEFMIGKYEITMGEYSQVLTGLYTGYRENFLRMPQSDVTWFDAVEFCNKLSVLHGFVPVYTIKKRGPEKGYPITSAEVSADFGNNGYRLPTEAEWEYVAKGGDGSPGNFTYSGSNELNEAGWFSGNSGSKKHDVGTKTANALGVFDMSGNLWEWCWDWHGSYGLGLQLDPLGASSGAIRVLRGGGWGNDAENCRSAYRNDVEPAGRSGGIGFRVLRRP